MLKEYTISDIIVASPKEKFYYVGTFEGTENPDVNWPHRHDFYSIVWFTDSSGINVIDFDEYEIKPDRLFLMHPGQVHNWTYSKESKGYILVFDKHIVKDLPPESIPAVFFDLTSKDIRLLKPLVENLIEESSHKDRLFEETVVSGISYLLFQLKKHTINLQQEKVKSASILAFSKLVSNTISENLAVTDYAQRLHITVDKLNEICKIHYGKSPKTMILEKRMTEAKRLLYFTDLSVKEIAHRLGFQDSSYFSRVFRRKTKMYPTAFKST